MASERVSKERNEQMNLKRLQLNYVKILNDIEADVLIPYMYQEEAITFEEKEEIENPKTRKLAARILLNIIFKKAIPRLHLLSMCNVFMESLRLNNYKDLMKIIEATKVEEDFDFGEGNDKTVCGRIVHNREITSKKGKLYTIIELKHRKHGILEATAHGHRAMHIARYLERGWSYILRHVAVKPVPEKFRSENSNKLEIYIKDETTVFCNTNEGIEHDNIVYKSIATIKQEKENSKVNLRAYIANVSDVSETPKQASKIQFVDLVDKSCHKIRIALFSGNIDRFEVGQKTDIQNTKLKRYKSELYLDTSSKTEISVLQDEEMDVRKPFRFQGKIDEIAVENCSTRACQHKNCDGRLKNQGEKKYVCKKCNRIYDILPQGYKLLLTLKVDNDECEVVGFDSIGVKLFKCRWETFDKSNDTRRKEMKDSVCKPNYDFECKYNKKGQFQVLDIEEVENESLEEDEDDDDGGDDDNHDDDDDGDNDDDDDDDDDDGDEDNGEEESLEESIHRKRKRTQRNSDQPKRMKRSLSTDADT